MILRQRLNIVGWSLESSETMESMAKIIDLLKGDIPPGTSVTIVGWIRTIRTQKSITFIQIYDTSCVKEIQVVADTSIVPEKLYVHGSVRIEGTVTSSPGREQSIEIQAQKITRIGGVTEHDPSTYPLAKTKLSLVHLRQFPHLRIRSRTMQAVMRISSALMFATHEFFRKRRTQQVFTPLMTTSDCEGGGEVFKVTTDYKEPFFSTGDRFLTVSGQLELEMYACGGLGDVFTFGPCFRAERSSTARHASEFLMLEAELLHVDLEQLIEAIESHVRYCIQYVLTECKDELSILESFQSPGITDRLRVMDQPFLRIDYRDAIAKLGVPFGTDLSSDQEKALISSLHDPPLPTFVMKYPQKIKAFYMKPAGDETVFSTDLLVPSIGELVGGSIREDDLDALKAVMVERGMKLDDFRQYLDLRRFGSVPHGGWGLGFARLVMMCTGMTHIKDVTPFFICYQS